MEFLNFQEKDLLKIVLHLKKIEEEEDEKFLIETMNL